MTPACPGGTGLPESLQGRLGQGQDDHQQGDLQEVHKKHWMILNVPCRYEIEWIGREGLAPETHDAYLKVVFALPTFPSCHSLTGVHQPLLQEHPETDWYVDDLPSM